MIGFCIKWTLTSISYKSFFESKKLLTIDFISSFIGLFLSKLTSVIFFYFITYWFVLSLKNHHGQI
jgi:hypothetical protein